MKHSISTLWRGTILIGVASLLAACGASTGQGLAPPSTTGAQASCPASKPLRSSAGRPASLAPGHPASTSFCLYVDHHLKSAAGYAGGPLDSALNTSLFNHRASHPCPAVARLPVVVVLKYRGQRTADVNTRYVVIDMGGCPAIVMHDGAQRQLTGRGAVITLYYYTRDSHG